MSKKRYQSKEKKALQNVKTWLQYIVMVYVIGMLGVFPLYYEEKYYNMGDAKYHFAKNFSIAVFSVLILLSCVYLCYLWKANQQEKGNFQWKKLLSPTDCFVIAYGVVVLISFLLSPYKKTGLWGYEGWFMGLMSQLLFILIYFFVSRFGKWKAYLLYIIMGVSTVIFVIAILNRFHIDPLGFYEGLSEYYIAMFLSTLGQATWYSSYACIMIPIGLFGYWYCKDIRKRILFGIYSFIGFATIVTQDSDSAYIATFMIFFVLFMVSFKEINQIKRLFEIIIIGLSSFRFIGLMQMMFPQKAVELQPLSIFCSQSGTTLILLILFVALYLILVFGEKRGIIKVSYLSWIPRVVCSVVMIAIPGILLLVYLATTQKLPSFLDGLYQFEYLTYNENWGNGRGFTWSACGKIFHEYPLITKIFGVGPDCFASYSREFYATMLAEKWGDAVLTNAHNEWFSTLLFFGVTGFVAYVGIFISTIVCCVRKCKENSFLIAVIMCVLAYMGHNLFCYQQIICTPIIFIIIGMGENFIRQQKLEIKKC